MDGKHKIIYLILGIGIGIIITNILHSFYPRLEYIQLSDDIIIERARDLGMVNLKENIKIEKEIIDEKEEILEKKVEEVKEEVKEVEIVVESGSGLTKVATQLHDADLIDNKEEFILLVKGKKLDKKIATGRFKVKSNNSYTEIIEILTRRPN